MSVDLELRCPISTDLGFVRDLVRLCGHHSGLRDQRLGDLVLAVNEAVANVLDHGAAGLVTFRTAGEAITVEVLATAGRLSRDHLASAQLDRSGQRGFGLWVIQHLCDAVALEQTGLGSLLSLHMDRQPATAPGPPRAPGPRPRCYICDIAEGMDTHTKGLRTPHGHLFATRTVVRPREGLHNGADAGPSASARHERDRHRRRG
ncbi:ATP-binding protein [Nonomuraea sp. SYSU D8015]|uniref:ATP-binding protein n=1 Tax=Nonomuraea sp. SYSU D8015 TaxID=2593644 RepID=UPI0016613D76|nr:ATP-binding protein [Nonomuraea sp. SYSU D8015]